MSEEKAEVTTSDAGAHLIVRVKRRREDDPAETICLYDDNHNNQPPVSKRNRKSLAEEMARAVTLKGDDQETNTSALASQPRKRLILQRVSTLENFSYATLDQDTAAALVKKRAREADADVANDGDHPATEGDASKRQRRVKLLVAQSKKTAALSLFVPHSPTTPASDAATAKKTCVIVDTMQIFDPTTRTTATPSDPAPIDAPSAAATSSATKKKIVNPPTRLLAQAIVTAVTRNDFNDLSRALIQGADINHQLDASHPTAGGYTALMAAAQRGNLRVLKRLLLDSSLTTVLAKNADGRTALELLPKPTPRTAMENQEMRQLLEQSTIRQHQEEALRMLEQQRQQQRVDRAFRHETSSVFSRFNNPHGAVNNTTGGEDYVVDIYVVQKQSSAEESSAAMDTSATTAGADGQDGTTAAPSSTESAMDEDATIPESFATSLSILRVEGLKIDDETGQVELVAYDSDWSDLADDEEPDSNDERYYANDYPDESDDDNGGRLFAELDDDHHQRDDDGLGDEYRDSNESDDDVGMGSKLQRRQQRRRQRHLKSHGFAAASSSSATSAATMPMQAKPMSMDATIDKHVTFEQPMMDADDDEDDGEGGEGDAEDDEDNEDDIEMDLAKELDSFFGGNQGSAGRGGGVGVGGGGGGGPDVTTLFDRQQRHSSRVLRAFDMHGTSQSHTTESLQELWDEVPADLSTSHREGERIGGMRERTGMVFAANAHEFDRETGLPKYGHELSDDDHDVVMQDLMPSRALPQGKPSRDTVAYDSDLDGDHSD